MLLFLACANPASADDGPSPPALASVSAKGLDQIVYKGLVGNALDGVPMDPSRRVSLQRANAIVSSTFSGRSLGVLAGLSNPVLLIGGLVWGVWAASNIQPEEDGMNGISDASHSGGEIEPQEGLLARPDSSAAAKGALAQHLPETASARSISAAEPDEPFRVRPRVLKVWLPQRSSTMAIAP